MTRPNDFANALVLDAINEPVWWSTGANLLDIEWTWCDACPFWYFNADSDNKSCNVWWYSFWSYKSWTNWVNDLGLWARCSYLYKDTWTDSEWKLNN